MRTYPIEGIMNIVSRLRLLAQNLSTTGLPLLALAVVAPSAFCRPAAHSNRLERIV